MVSILSASLKASFDAALQDTLRADLVLTSSSFTPFSQEVATRTAAVEGVEAVSQFRQGGFKVNDSDAAMTGVDPGTIEAVANLGPSDGAIESLASGDVLVYDQTMQDNGWAVGDELPSAFATVGDDPLTIGGTFDDNRLVGDYVVSLDTFDELFRAQLDTFVFVKAAEGADVATVRGGRRGSHRRVRQHPGAGPGRVPRAAGGLREPAARPRDRHVVVRGDHRACSGSRTR